MHVDDHALRLKIPQVLSEAGAAPAMRPRQQPLPELWDEPGPQGTGTALAYRCQRQSHHSPRMKAGRALHVLVAQDGRLWPSKNSRPRAMCAREVRFCPGGPETQQQGTEIRNVRKALNGSQQPSIGSIYSQRDGNDNILK